MERLFSQTLSFDDLEYPFRGRDAHRSNPPLIA
jgi:hypothetical protein